jgi:hypothetical protein
VPQEVVQGGGDLVPGKAEEDVDPRRLDVAIDHPDA